MEKSVISYTQFAESSRCMTREGPDWTKRLRKILMWRVSMKDTCNVNLSYRMSVWIPSEFKKMICIFPRKKAKI